MQKFLAAAARIGGVTLLFKEHFVIGALLTVADVRVFNGAARDELYSFDFTDWSGYGDSNSSDGGGGDGGGD